MKNRTNKKTYKFAEGTIYSRPQSRFWQCYMPLNGGKMIRQSTGILISSADSLEQARLFLANLRQSKSQLAKPTRKEQAYKQALTLIAQDCGYSPTRLTIKDAIAKYMAFIEASEGTKRLYKEALSKFEKHFGGETLIDSISSKSIEEYRTKLSTKLSFDTVKHSINCVKIFFNYLIHNQFIDSNPLKMISRFTNKEQKKHIRIFTKQEIDLLLKETEGTYLHTLIYLGLFTGQRLMDCFNLRWEQVDLESNAIHFHIQKTKKDFVSIIHPKLKEYLISIPDKEGKLFKTDKSQAHLSIEFHRLLLKLHIISPKQKGNGKRKNRADLTFHSLRKTLNSWLASSGISPEIRSKIIGNTKEINQKHYTEIQDEAVISAINNLKI